MLKIHIRQGSRLKNNNFIYIIHIYITFSHSINLVARSLTRAIHYKRDTALCSECCEHVALINRIIVICSLYSHLFSSP